MSLIQEEHELERQLVERINRGEKVWDAHNLPIEFLNALVELLWIQERCETRGGENYLRYCIRLAPSLKEVIFMAHTGLEEVKHGEKVCEVLATLGEQPKPAKNLWEEKYILRIFQHPELFKSWGHVLMFNLLMDGAAAQQLAEFKNGPYGPWIRVIAEIEEEEAGHVEHGIRGIQEWTQQENGFDELQDALNDWWPWVMDVFGSPDNKNSRRLAMYRKYHLKQITNDGARIMFRNSVEGVLGNAGLQIPMDAYARVYGSRPPG